MAADSEGRSSATYSSARPHTIPPSVVPNEDINAPAVIVASDETIPSGPPAQMTMPMSHGIPSPGPHPAAGMPPPMGSPQSPPHPFTPQPFPQAPGRDGVGPADDSADDRATSPTAIAHDRRPHSRSLQVAKGLGLPRDAHRLRGRRDRVPHLLSRAWAEPPSQQSHGAHHDRAHSQRNPTAFRFAATSRDITTVRFVDPRDRVGGRSSERRASGERHKRHTTEEEALIGLWKSRRGRSGEDQMTEAIEGRAPHPSSVRDCG